jgi:hypothetical protein
VAFIASRSGKPEKDPGRVGDALDISSPFLISVVADPLARQPEFPGHRAWLLAIYPELRRFRMPCLNGPGARTANLSDL